MFWASVIFTASLNSADAVFYTSRFSILRPWQYQGKVGYFLINKNDENKCMGLLHVFTTGITTMTNVHLTLH